MGAEKKDTPWKDSSGSSQRHSWLLAIPCLTVAGVLVAVTRLDIPIRQAVLYALLLICPLSHLALMGLHRAGRHEPRRLVESATPLDEVHKEHACH